MTKELRLVVFIFFILLLGFISLVIFSEHKNMEKLREDYPELSDDTYNYRKEGLRVWAIRLILSFLLPLLFLVTRFSYRIRFLVGGEKPNFLTGLLYGAIFFSLLFLIKLPLNYYSSFYLSHKYGISNQTFARWLEVMVKNFLVNDLVLSFFIFIPFYLIYRYPSIWWLQISFLIIPAIIFMVFITPFVIDPIFNKYSPMDNEVLEEGINSLLEKADIEGGKIFKVDKSKDTKTMNAYMTGIFNSKRIVFWDTSLNNLEEDEILSIAAHEIGHYKENHIWKSIGLGSLGTLFIMFLVFMTSNWILDLSKGSFGIRNLYDIGTVPLLILVLNIYLFLGNPIINHISRTMEIEADRYEIVLGGNREAAVSAMEKLYEQSLGLPRPSKIYKLWYHTHPPLEERIDFYRNYEIK